MNSFKMHNPPHPGKILQDLILDEYNLSILDFATKVGLESDSVQSIFHCRSDITAEMALRLSLVIGTTPQFWLNLQMNYDFFEAKQKFDKLNIHLEPLSIG
jgi:antitoxin HigA-1